MLEEQCPERTRPRPAVQLTHRYRSSADHAPLSHQGCAWCTAAAAVRRIHSPGDKLCTNRTAAAAVHEVHS